MILPPGMTASSPSCSKLNLVQDDADFDSTFDDLEGRNQELEEERQKKARRWDLATKDKKARHPKADKALFTEEVTQDEGRRQRFQLLSLNAYDRHKKLVNDYLLYFEGSTARLERDASKDRKDIDVIRENHRFLWDGEGEGQSSPKLTWGQTLAKRYYEKLFKEYCICDVSRYKENKVAMRWRTEQEVMDGKGQFRCGARKCQETETLRTWEVNFAYVEEGEKKNALVKVRLCPDCSYKINYHHKKKEVTRRKLKKEKKKKKGRKRRASGDSSSEDESIKEKKKKLKEESEEIKLEKEAADVWSAPVEVEEEKSRDQDFAEFLDDLFL